MTEPKNTWDVWRWERVENDDLPASAPPPLSEEVRSELWDQLARMEDHDDVTIPAWVLRSLMAGTEFHGRKVTGAWMHDESRGVNYRATIHTDGPEARLRTLEIEPLRDDVDESVFQPPVKSIVRTVRRHLRERERTEQSGAIYLGRLGEPTRPGTSARPTNDVLCRHLAEDGWTRTDIAEEYGVSPGAAGQWLRRARKESPELPWPPRARPGVKAQAADGGES